MTSRLEGLGAFSPLVSFPVDGINLQGLIFFSFYDILCSDNHRLTLSSSSGGGGHIVDVLKCLESVRKLPCQLRALQRHAVWLKEGCVSEENPSLQPLAVSSSVLKPNN